MIRSERAFELLKAWGAPEKLDPEKYSKKIYDMIDTMDKEGTNRDIQDAVDAREAKRDKTCDKCLEGIKTMQTKGWVQRVDPIEVNLLVSKMEECGCDKSNSRPWHIIKEVRG